MKTSIAYLISFVFVAVLWAQSDAVLMVELSNDAAQDYRANSVLPKFISLDSRFKDAALTPTFYEPKDPAHADTYFELGMNRWFRLDLKGISTELLASSLTSGNGLLKTELIYPATGGVTPNDFSNYDMWGLTRMQCPAAWDIATGNSQILVSTIDTGCRIQHPDLAANIYVNPGEDLNGNGIWDASDNNGTDNDGNGFIDDVSGWDFVSHNTSGSESPAAGEEYSPRDNLIYPDIHGHGTHVAGTLAGVTNNGTGVASASWNVKQVSLRAGYACIIGGNLNSRGYWDDFAAAIQYAVDRGARVISISFYGSSGFTGLQQAIQYARAHNCLVFCCAGNDNSSGLRYPAAYPEALAVAATDQNDVRASFSSYGTWIDLCAPGVNIWSTMCNSSYNPVDYAAWQGTSMSTPNAGGVAALMLSFNPNLTDDQVETTIRSTCTNINAQNPGFNGMLGSGRVSAWNAIVGSCGPTPYVQLSSPANNAAFCGEEVIQFCVQDFGTQLSYHFQFDDNLDFNSLINEWWTNQHCTTANLPMAPGETMYWRVRTEYGPPLISPCVGPWSETRTLYTIQSAPPSYDPWAAGCPVVWGHQDSLVGWIAATEDCVIVCATVIETSELRRCASDSSPPQYFDSVLVLEGNFQQITDDPNPWIEWHYCENMWFLVLDQLGSDTLGWARRYYWYLTADSADLSMLHCQGDFLPFQLHVVTHGGTNSTHTFQDCLQLNLLNSGDPPLSAPAGFVAASVAPDSSNDVNLTWLPNPESNIAYYVIYRNDHSFSPTPDDSVGYTMTNSFQDLNIPLWGRIHYRIAATSTAGCKGACSPEQSVIVRSPHALFLGDTTSRFVVPDYTFLNFGPFTPLGVGVWYKTAGSNRLTISKGRIGWCQETGPSWSITLGYGFASIAMCAAGNEGLVSFGRDYQIPEYVINDDQWHTFSVVAFSSGNEVSLYLDIDDHSFDEDVWIGNWTTMQNEESLVVAASQSGSVWIDELAINMMSGTVACTPLEVDSLSYGTYWRFDEAAGVVDDYGNHGVQGYLSSPELRVPTSPLSPHVVEPLIVAKGYDSLGVANVFQLSWPWQRCASAYDVQHSSSVDGPFQTIRTVQWWEPTDYQTVVPNLPSNVGFYRVIARN